MDPLLDLPPSLPGPARRLSRRASTDGGVRRLWIALAVLFLVGLGSCMRVGSHHPSDPYLTDEQVPSGIGSFAKIGYHVVHLTDAGPASGPQFCGLLAASEAQRQQGLMGRHDLGGYDGMVFRFDQDTQTPFYMRATPIALSVAFFDAQGRFVSSADMDPCPDKDGCPLYQATGPYRTALEVRRGGLVPIGISHGASLSVGGTCAPAAGGGTG